jgi:hypothetical protein
MRAHGDAVVLRDGLWRSARGALRAGFGRAPPLRYRSARAARVVHEVIRIGAAADVRRLFGRRHAADFLDAALVEEGAARIPVRAAGAVGHARALMRRRAARVGALTRATAQRHPAPVVRRSATVAELCTRHRSACTLPGRTIAAARFIARTRAALDRVAAAVRGRAARDVLSGARLGRARACAAAVRRCRAARLPRRACAAGQHPAAPVGDAPAIEPQARTRRGDARARMIGRAGEADCLAGPAIDPAAAAVFTDAAAVVEIRAGHRDTRVLRGPCVLRRRVQRCAAVVRACGVRESAPTRCRDCPRHQETQETSKHPLLWAARRPERNCVAVEMPRSRRARSPAQRRDPATRRRSRVASRP